MDNTIRKNEHCVIGLPRCDYVFSSTRSCFIAYGYEDSPLEMNILGDILRNRGIEPVEAGGFLSPGQNSFCAKICSKIITSQFCVVLLNNEESGSLEVPNANVNMEYGLMLGFNKYVVPFQRKNQKLPFNVVGLDTVKYTNSDFKRLAEDAIDHAIKTTNQPSAKELHIDEVLNTFLLSKEAAISDVSDHGERIIFQLGSQLGFNLLNDFSGLKYIYLGNFTNLRVETILWRIKLLQKILEQRVGSLPRRVELGLVTMEQLAPVKDFLRNIEIWIVVNTDDEKRKVTTHIEDRSMKHSITMFSLDEVRREVGKIST